MKLPKHINLHIEHNPHKSNYETVEAWESWSQSIKEDWITESERLKALETQDFWTVQWYPITPIGFYRMQAHSLDNLLEYVNNKEWE